jgi:SAM-dependent methyltransferase
MSENTYRLSKDLSILDIETIYREIVLKQEFYGSSYGASWSPQPYLEMANILLSLLCPKRHLDIGCGEGFLVRAMRSLNIDSWGIDYSEALISRGSKEVKPYIDVVSAENWIEKSSLGNVDCVTLMEVFEHLPVSIIKDLLKKLHQIEGNIFLTIPSYGADSVFRRGVIVNDGTPNWKFDMMSNRPFRNIVLENELPHLGHITLASYRWWTEFFLSQGYMRNFDKETQCSQTFRGILEKYKWNPYILKSPKDCPANLIDKKEGKIFDGFYEYEAVGGGRWTNGYGRFIWLGGMPKSIKMNYILPSINVIHDFPILLVIERLIELKGMQFAWQVDKKPQYFSDNKREKLIEHIIKLEYTDNNCVCNDCVKHNVWRINLISPSWVPNDYNFSSDSRILGIFLNEVFVNAQ